MVKINKMSIVNTIFDILEIIVGACAVFNGVFCFIWNIIHFTDFYWAFALYIIIAPLYTALFGAMIIITAVMSPGWLNQLCGFLTNFFGYGCFMLLFAFFRVSLSFNNSINIFFGIS